MGKEADRKKYLRNCATTLKGQLGLNAEQFKGCKTFAEIEAKLHSNGRTFLEIRLMESPDEQVGKLACIGNEREARRLAAEAVIPAIANKLWAELNPKKVVKCRFCDFTATKYRRGSAITGFDIMRDHIDGEHPDKANEIAIAIYGSRDARDEADIEEYENSLSEA